MQLMENYPACEYLLVLEPHEALRNTIMEIKKDFAEKFEHPPAAYSKPHITLVRFRQYEMAEQRLVARLKPLIAASDSFLVELEDYGSFPTHTIYINVKTKTQLTTLVKSMRPLQRLMKMNEEHKPHFITEPHLTIARKLLPWQYEKGWLEYSHGHFNGKFMADQVLLLRKRLHEKRYETAYRFQLLHEQHEAVQTTLF